MGVFATPGRSNASPPPFVGRDKEISRLEGMLAQAAEGIPAAAVISGEAGVGKSRLLREFIERARHSGAQVLCGSCVALGSGELPYAPLIDALRRLVRELGEASVRESVGGAYTDLADLISDFSDADPRPVQEPTSQLRVFGAVLRLLDGLGAARVAVLVLEDMQWADPSTLDLFGYLARAQTNERVLLVCSYRSTDLPLRHPLRTLVTELELARRIQRIELARFTPTELRVFVHSMLGADVSRELMDRAFDLSDGNAFFAEELVVAGVLTDATSTVRLPGSLRDLVLTRFEQLGDDAREVMRVAATAGRRVSHRLLAAVSTMDGRRMLLALRECVAHHMLVVDPVDDTYVFRHALLREAVHQELLPGERLGLHAAMAAALTTDTQLSYAEDLTVAAELSYHWYEAGAFPEALAAAVRAGDTAVRVRAFREAERQYQRALDLWLRSDSAPTVAAVTRDRLLASAADAARWSGHLERAVHLIRQALAEIDRGRCSRLGELQERLGSYLWEAGDSVGSQRAYVEASALLADQPPSAVAARVLAGQATADIRAGRYSAALQLADDAAEMAREVGAKAEEGRALNIVGVALTMIGKPDEGVEALREALRIADAAVHLEDMYRAYGNLTLALENAGQLDESVSVALEGLQRARHFGVEHTRGQSVLANNAGAALVLLGRWDEAAEIIADVLVDRPVNESLYPRLTLAEICVARGRFEEADRLLATVRESGRMIREPQFVGALHACEAEWAIWRREYDLARVAVADGLGAISEAENVGVRLRLYALGLRVEVDDWLRLSALPDRARSELARVRSTVDNLSAGVDRVGQLGGKSFLPDAGALRLLCAAERARWDDLVTPSQWAQVGAAWESLDRPYPAAYALWREAEAAAGSKDRTRAVRAARQAHRTVVRLGARPLRDEIEALARRARLDLADVPVRAPEPATPVDPFGLTQREREVLRHLCQGQSNRQIASALFITDKTASVHITNILRKLGVTSRGAAAAVAHRLGLCAEPDIPNQ